MTDITAEQRLEREQVLTNRLHCAVFTSPEATKDALTHSATHLRIELLRGVLLGADYALWAEGFNERTRDRICHRIIFGDAPRDPDATPDEQAEAARAEEKAKLKAQVDVAHSLLGFRIPAELLANIPTPEQQARDALAELQSAMLKLAVSETPGDDDTAWDIAREAAEWAMSIYGPPGVRHSAYIVVLDEGLGDDDTEQMLRLLMRIRGVVGVEPIEEDHLTHITEARVRSAVSEALSEALEPFWGAPRRLGAGSPS